MPFSKPTRLLFAAVYLLLVSVLFFLPGAAFPKQSWLDRIYFDKWVHIGLFAFLAIAWCWALSILSTRKLVTLFIALFLYGWVVEFIQEAWIQNRAFDAWDIVGDGVGNVVGIWFWKSRVYTKK